MADIKLKNYQGESQTYTAVPKIYLEAAESTEENPVLVPFSYGEPISMEVEPDFSAGDMAVPVADGQLIKELSVLRPKNLIPGNVASGVEIAGIIGTLAAGGGGSTGSARMKTGFFRAPSRDTVVTASFVEGADGTTRDADGLWKITKSPAAFQLTAGVTYAGNLVGVTDYVTAESHTSFAGYGRCVTIGNKFLATGNQADNTREMWLAIYRQSVNASVIMVWNPARDYQNSSGDMASPDSLAIWNPETSAQTVTIEHGGTEIPDFVLVHAANMGTTADATALFYIWGVKSKLAALTYGNKVGQMGYAPLFPTTETYPLDAGTTNPNMYIYCLNETTFSISPSTSNKAIQLWPGSTYRWFAVWGISSESE